MPKIPVYDQQQLASSRVGTPGVDTSVSSAFQSVANNAEQVRNSVYQLQNDLKTLEAQQQVQSNGMQSAQHQFMVDNVLDQKLSELKTAHAADPDKAVEEFRNFAPDYISKYSDSITNPSVKNTVYTQSLNRAREQVGTMQASWLGEARIKAGIGRYESMADTLNVGMGITQQQKNEKGEVIGVTALSVEDAVQKLNNFGQQSLAYQPIYGTKLPQVVRQAQEKGAESYLNTLAYNNPDLLSKVIDNGIFDSYIDGSSRNAIYGKAKSYALEQKKLLVEQQKLETSKAHMEVSTQYEALRRSGTGTTKDYDALADQASLIPGITPGVVNAIRAGGTTELRRQTSEQKAESKASLREQQKASMGQAATTVNNITAEFKPFQTELATALNTRGGAGVASALDRINKLTDKITAADIQYQNAYGRTSSVLAGYKAQLQAYTVGITNGKQFGRQVQEVNNYQRQMAPPRFSNDTKTNSRYQELYRRSVLSTYAAWKQAGKDPTSDSARIKIRNALIQQIQAKMRTNQ